MERCPFCAHEVHDPKARFCPACGRKLYGADDPAGPGAAVPLADAFLRRLQHRLKEEHPGSDFTRLAEHFYASGFRDMLAQQQEEYLLPPGEAFWEDALDTFIIYFGREVLAHALPEAILRYQGKRKEEIHLQTMIWDFLAPAEEQDRFYRDMTQMPLEVLQNASRFFLTPMPRERIYLLCDQSILANGQEGFAFTDLALYWKAYLHSARRVAYADIEEVSRKKSWLLINGHFFDGGSGLNAKVMRLLNKLARLYQ